MKLYTCQIAKHRVAKEKGIPFLDITVRRFAPTWKLLNEYKATRDQYKYRKIYTQLMQNSYRNNKNYWLELLKKDELVIGCYYKVGDFCHRLLLVGLFKKVCSIHNIPFEYKGELK